MLHIDEVEWRGGYTLRLVFDTGETKIVDVRPLLKGPIFEPLLDAKVFSSVSIDLIARTVAWPNGADLAPEALYALDSKASPADSQEAITKR